MLNQRRFCLAIAVLGASFAVAFFIVVIPELVRHPNVFAALAAGFVNPFAAGYAMDAITCWLILAVWVFYEARTKGIKRGWVALVLGVAPGVATGLAVYLLLRLKHEQQSVRAQP